MCYLCEKSDVSEPVAKLVAKVVVNTPVDPGSLEARRRQDILACHPDWFPSLALRKGKSRGRTKGTSLRNLKPLSDLLAQRKESRPIAGVYFLFDDDELVYIGQSVDIEGRIAHHRGKALKKFDSYTILECSNEILSELERRYIVTYRPRYNVMHNSDYVLSELTKEIKESQQPSDIEPLPEIDQ